MSNELASNCCRLAEISYLSDQSIFNTFRPSLYPNKDRFLSECTRPNIIHGAHNAMCFITKYNNNFLISFRGTDCISEFMTDINIIQVNLELLNIGTQSLPKVHKGFFKQFESLKYEILDILNIYMFESTQPSFIFTGHSLGGALATIASTYFGHTYPSVYNTCITFGSPRVGNQNFVNCFDTVINRSERYVNYEDPIPDLPLALYYKHVSGLKYITKNNEIIDNHNEGCCYNCWRDIFSCLCCCHNPITDHSCTKYYEKLQ